MATTVANTASTQEKLLRARAASAKLAQLSTEQKNALLLAIADALEEHEKDILAANRADIAHSGLEGAIQAYGARAAIAAGGPEADPSAEIDRRWTRSVVRSSLAELPDAERRVLVLAYDEDLSQSQIAARLGLPIGTVKSRTRRAMAILRARLTEIPELMN